MTVTLPDTEPLEALRTRLETEFAVHTARLTQLTVYSRLPRHGGHDPVTLEVRAASSRRRIAETARALRRMSEGTYGVCGDCRQPIPLGRLRAQPWAEHCAICRRPG